MNIVIPMAGKGQRFLDAGYKQPKPFIRLKGMSMIETVIRNLDIRGSHILLSQNSHLANYKDELNQILNSCSNGMKNYIVPIEHITEGAACTVLLASHIIDNDEPLIIANCDQLVCVGGYMRNAIKYFEDNNADGGILCFLNDNPKWSYAKIVMGKTPDKKRDLCKITEVVEKKVVSNLATVGIYYFKHGKTFVHAANKMIRKDIRVNNEFYVAPVYNELIESSRLVIPYMVNEMIGLGTPEDLEVFTNDIG